MFQQMPDLASDYPLTPAQVTDFREKGWVLLRQLASQMETESFRPVLSEVTMANSRQQKPLAERDTYGKAFIQVGNLWEKDARTKQFTLSRRFAKVAAELMGVRGVRIYHDQALFKEPGGGYTPWHQDQQYWPLDGAKCVTLWMPLVDADSAMGTMRFASGSHRLGYLGPMNISDDSEEQLKSLVVDKGYPIDAAGDMRAGDATFHDGWTIHGAPGNESKERTREVMTIIYVEDGADITEPDSPQRANDLRAWFPNRKPGDKADSELNPLVFRQGE